MSNLLVVKAHPLEKENSRSMKVLDRFITSYQAKNPQDTLNIVDLYKENIPEIDEEILLAWNQLGNGKDFAQLTESQQAKLLLFNQSTEQFIAVNKIVIVNALWNLTIPTRLKAWIDTICVAGKTFRYTENGPEALTRGKKALHIQSSGSIYEGKDFASLYLEQILTFIGIHNYEQLLIEGIDQTPEREEELMNKAFDAAELLGTTF
ncbi:FMN-dependent NADH-azoreductase [Melissococcus plutonius]|uniref:FMN dependent NADH:quinone oxidoreductase n=1 Tax=Melissococcus plutonius (strain ATCC 35311 / DSM 29964 / CIP 104052 / LMG 20360 / NCIMB 702443) TaxID=940190 RepID=F3YBV9_MELPT|nr:FMN-dependent NADH-azoreductase [Melissococcus plutonius]AIM25256.1 FMN-dependent NADH-azoreductase AzoR [Melissococcus plutonius S1]KMT23938.1 FMN-dependent NADH-azoreductase AzoR [Melissococcus plutonius]KMT24461.1 FMN-dependent NADH-azoreductase AzoR [Melissococcus plutonius]KMT26034.1 FMN-dependent NADH-azoreductase AzoR [Melissococcus plutonius]KMT28583.1 FMN-dependent NADH-azoreductase AzoR [Melissococcus plutonius]